MNTLTKKIRCIVILAAFAVMISPLYAHAAPTDTAEVTIVVPGLLDITLDPATAKDITSTVSAADMITGYKSDIFGGSFKVYSNDNWFVNVKASDTTFSTLGGTGTPGKSINNLNVNADSSFWFGLNGTTNVLILSGPAQSGTEHTLAYKFNFDASYRPGDYNAYLTYTISN